MGREIKFRAWNGYKLVYGPTDGKDSPTWVLSMCLAYGFDAEQFTGRHDNNGVEIYEGDIVESQNMKKGIVEYFESLTWEGGGLHPGFYCRSWFDTMEMEEHGLSYYQDFDGCKIIGNIHEGVKQ